MDIYDNIAAKKYEAKSKYPRKPVDPLRNKVVSSMSEAEVLAIPEVRKKYQADMEEYMEKMMWYRQEQKDCDASFFEDLNEEFGLIQGDPFCEKLTAIAWREGHSGGYGNVVSCLSDLVPLWELYQAKGKN